MREEREQILKERAELAAMRAEIEAAQKAAEPKPAQPTSIFLTDEQLEAACRDSKLKQTGMQPVVVGVYEEPATDEDFEQEPSRGIVQPDRAELPEDVEAPNQRRPGYIYHVCCEIADDDRHEDHEGNLLSGRVFFEGDNRVEEFKIPQEGGAS